MWEPLAENFAEAKMRVGVSKLAHAYMRSLSKTNDLVREHYYTVRSTGWMMHNSHATNLVAIEALMKELSRARE